MSTPVRTARWTGVAYLALGAFGAAGFLVIRPQLHIDADPAATLASLVERSGLAHLGIALELLVVVAQALAALGFFALFRRDRPTAAFGVAVFGMANASAILTSGALLVVASQVAADPGLAPAGDAAATTASLLFAISNGLWAVGGVFFGLWLIPMGWFVLSTGRMPRLLGWTLVVGGAGYLASALLGAAAPAAPSIAVDLLTIPATIGELWMIGYLLVRGIRPHTAAAETVPEHRSA